MTFEHQRVAAAHGVQYGRMSEAALRRAVGARPPKGYLDPPKQETAPKPIKAVARAHCPPIEPERHLPPEVARILAAVVEASGCPAALMRGPGFTREAADPRMVAYLLLRRRTLATYEEIGLVFHRYYSGVRRALVNAERLIERAGAVQDIHARAVAILDGKA